MTIISKNTKDTNKVAKVFWGQIIAGKRKLKEGATIVGLYGDLGAGKTTFMQYLARHAGVKRKVNSPTFVILKKYKLPLGKPDENKFEYIYHMDAYRLKDEKELENLAWDKIISKKEHLIFVEWPERIIKAMPKNHSQIHISHTNEGHRKFKIKGN